MNIQKKGVIDMLSSNIEKIISGCLEIKNNQIKILNENKLAEAVIDKLVWEAVFGSDSDKKYTRWIIWELAQELGIYPASINDLYMARGQEKVPLNFSVPAMNLRGMAYDMAKAIFRTALKLDTKAMIFEIARSEMGYCAQPPSEYTTVVLGAAVKEGFVGPVFIQGDHLQTKASSPGVPKDGEIEIIKKLMVESINNGFYNIDIDTSTLVDLDKPTVIEQQESNIKYSLEFAKHFRNNELSGITVSLGGELGHIGGKNSTGEEFKTYIKEFNKNLPSGLVGMSKISVQTGTSHGGVVLKDGTLADIDVDFNVLREISKACREEKISGAVQHGASTLPDKYFNQFVKAEAIEVHLATGFQNIMMDHKAFPKDLLKKMYLWCDEEKTDERKNGQTDEQFHYKTRKKAWGQFKKECWSIDNAARSQIRKSLEDRFTFLFQELNVGDTSNMINKFIKPVVINKKLEDFSLDTVTTGNVKNLAD